MAAFIGLFDPATSDEPIEDLEDLLSASAALEGAKSASSGRRNRSNHSVTFSGSPKAERTSTSIRAGLPPRSKTALDLSEHFRTSSAEMANFVNTKNLPIFWSYLLTFSKLIGCWNSSSSNANTVVSLGGRLQLLATRAPAGQRRVQTQAGEPDEPASGALGHPNEMASSWGPR